MWPIVYYLLEGACATPNSCALSTDIEAQLCCWLCSEHREQEEDSQDLCKPRFQENSCNDCCTELAKGAFQQLHMPMKQEELKKDWIKGGYVMSKTQHFS